MKDILFITNVPSPYRIDFFNELGKRCNLTVVFQKVKSKERKDNWDNFNVKNFKAIFLNGISVNSDSALSFKIKKIIKQNKNSQIVVCGFSSPTNIIAIRYLKRKKIPYYIEIDGGSPWLPDGKLSLKEKFKKRICSGAIGYFSSGDSGDQYLLRYGALKENIHRYPFTSLFEDDISKNVTDESTKNELKKKYNFTESKCVLTIGRFSYENGFGKGFDVFVDVASKFANEDIGFYIIGDEPTPYFKNLKEERKLEHLHFLPFFTKDKLFELYKCSDLTMILSRGDVWGLVVNESLANGVPVISSNLCLGGKELIKDNVNGFVVGLEDVDYICQKVKELIDDKNTYSKNSLESIKKYTIENMVKEHLLVLGEENENLD